ncbi:MAG: FAD-dependent monooxygenase [Elusimicrobia bacterium]|nr:FAD-dependent monooxygenase [Elusimicrobiota bacterium]MDE2314370.1 FAD-dependent monooxygenase [Elusimicrobiota bacterium]
MSEDAYDAIVVGAGPAGTSAAIVMAKAGLKVALLERGEYPGAKNVQGAVLYSRMLHEIVPEFWKEPDAPVERPVVEQKTCITTEDSWITVGYKSLKFLEGVPNCFTIIRVKFDRWYAQKAEAAGAEVFTGVTVRDVVKKDGKIVGIKTSDGDELMASVVLACDGVNSILAQKAGFRGELKSSEVALGAKEVIALDPKIIEDRFALNPGEGATMELFGSVTLGMLGYGFIYTNKESVSLGVGCKLSEYQKKGIRPSDHLEILKSHPFIKKLISGGKTLEYSAHLIPEGGIRSMPPLAADGFLVAGDAAQMTNPAFREGSNLAMTSGKLAGETVIEAKAKGDFSKAALSAYVDKLQKSYVLKDMEETMYLEESVEKSPGFLDFYPKLACDLAHMRFSADGQPKKDHLKKALALVRKRGFLRIARDLWPLRKAAV